MTNGILLGDSLYSIPSYIYAKLNFSICLALKNETWRVKNISNTRKAGISITAETQINKDAIY